MAMYLEKNGILKGDRHLNNLNIFKNADFHSLIATVPNWNQDKNGGLRATNWDGYNSGVTNASTCYHAHLTQLESDGPYVYDFTREVESWLGVWQVDLQSNFEIGETYTFSCEQYITDGSNNHLTGGLYYFKTGNTTSASFGLGQFDFSSLNREQWEKFTYTFTIPNDINLSQTVRWYIYGYVGGAGTIYMKNPKLEIGEEATLFTTRADEGGVPESHNFVEEKGLDRFEMFKYYAQAKEFIEL